MEPFAKAYQGGWVGDMVPEDENGAEAAAVRRRMDVFRQEAACPGMVR